MSSTGPTTARIVPFVPLLTNEMFLRAIFGDEWRRVKVTMFAGDPRKQPRGSWQGFPAEDMLKAAHGRLNTYCSVGLQTGTSRGLAGFEAAFLLVIDDVALPGGGMSGSVLGPARPGQADLARAEALLGRPPNYLLETSPGNCQAGWFTEMTDLAWTAGLVRNLYEAMGRQADNLKNLVTLVRLPVGTNGKAELGPKGFPCRLVLWSPLDRAMDWTAIESRIGTSIPVARRLSQTAGGMPDPGEIEADSVLRAFRLLGMVQGAGRPTTMGWGFDVDCPWIEEHTGRAREGTSYVPVRQRFHCHHGHCQDRTMGDVRVRLNEMLAEDSGGLATLAGLEFDEDVDEEGLRGQPDAAGKARRVLAQYEATEDGLALAFAAEHAGRLRFDHLRQKWFVWTGSCWQQDGVGQAFRWARGLARAFRQLQDAGGRALGKIAVAGAIERAARVDPQLAVSGQDWDQDPWLAGAPGCEIALRSGTSRAPDPAHGTTRQLLVAPARQATPVWDGFLWDSTGADIEMIGFLQAWMGYCLTGDTSEEKFVFIHGPGGNGKSTFMGVFMDILGDYAVTTPVDTFMLRKHPAHPAEIARLAGARAVAANEIEEGSTFNAVRLKELTGRSGAIAARFMRQDFFQFVPQFKITFVGNHQPKLIHVDAAMQRRLILVPFTQTPARADPTLKDRLVAEYPGILDWAIKGENLRRTRGGLAALIPASVVAATRAYLDEQDLFRAWAEDRCEFGPGFSMTPSEGFEDYRTWCHNNGSAPVVGERQFSRRFLESFPRCEYERTKHARKLVGTRLLPQTVVG